MPAPGLSFDIHAATVAFSTDGLRAEVFHRSRPGAAYLTLAGVPTGELVTADQVRTPLQLVAAEPVVDTDELEVQLSRPEVVQLTIRHTLVAGWRTRCAFANLSERSIRIEQPTLPLAPGPACLGWALAAGAEAAYSLHPRDGGGPVLTGRLRQGSVHRIGPAGLELPALELAPGARYVLGWEWEWFESPAACRRSRPCAVPAASVTTVGTVVPVVASPDVALVAPPGVGVDLEEDRYEFTSYAPGRHRVELRSARGVTEFDLTWVPTETDELAEAAAEAMAGRRSSAGVVRLRNLSEALVVQSAVRSKTLDDLDESHDALDLFTARRSADLAGDPLLALYLAEEHARTGDEELLAEATELVEHATAAAPGLGLAATKISMARLVGGRSVGGVVERVRALAAEVDVDAELASPLARQLAAAELLAVTVSSAAGPEADPSRPAADGRDSAGLLRLVGALGLHLGAGLPGAAVAPPTGAELGHLLTVLALLPEPLGLRPQPSWGIAATVLAQRCRPRLIERLAREPVGPGHAWLAVLAGLE